MEGAVFDDTSVCMFLTMISFCIILYKLFCNISVKCQMPNKNFATIRIYPSLFTMYHSALRECIKWQQHPVQFTLDSQIRRIWNALQNLLPLHGCSLPAPLYISFIFSGSSRFHNNWPDLVITEVTGIRIQKP